VDQIELGVPGLGKKDLARVADADRAPSDLQDHLFVGHGVTLREQRNLALDYTLVMIACQNSRAGRRPVR
jgi:hypothetical protein